MKVLFVRASDIYNDSRATKEIEAISLKHDVCVVGWDRHGGAIQRTKMVFRDKKKIYIKFFSHKIKGGIGLSDIILLIKWKKYVLKITEEYKPDVVHACDLIAGIVLKSYCKKENIKIIYDMYDHFVDSHNLPSIFNPLFVKFENSVVNYSYATIICNNERKVQIATAKPNKIVIIYNSPDISTIASKDNTEFLSDYVYCGALNGGRLIEEILDLYHDNHDLRFVVAGYGVLEEKLLKLNIKYDNLSFRGSISYDEVLKNELNTRVLSAVYDPSIKNNRLCAPNKFYEALALSKPVIVCKGTGIDKIVKKENIGLVINYDADEFYKAIRYLLEHPQECIEMGKRGKKLYDKSYSWELMKMKLGALYDEI